MIVVSPDLWAAGVVRAMCRMKMRVAALRWRNYRAGTSLGQLFEPETRQGLLDLAIAWRDLSKQEGLGKRRAVYPEHVPHYDVLHSA